VECIRTMKERGLDWTDEYQLREFANLYVVSILGTVRILHFGVTYGVLSISGGPPIP